MYGHLVELDAGPSSTSSRSFCQQQSLCRKCASVQVCWSILAYVPNSYELLHVHVSVFSIRLMPFE